MRYAVLPFYEAFRKSAPLHESNHQESGEPLPLQTDAELYRQISDCSPSFGILAYDGDRPVGVCTVIVTVSPHTSLLYATNDTLYCLPDYRSRGVGGQLYARAMKEAKSRGAEVFQWQANVGSAFDKALARRFSPLQHMYEVTL